MRRPASTLVAGLALAGALAWPAPAPAADDTRSLIQRIETQYEARTAHNTMRMRVVTKAWAREMVLETWSQGRDRFLARVLAPKKDAGTATLKVGDDLWNYLPKIDRLIKVPSSLMGDRWMGSHLTNDDLVKARKVDELYTFAEAPGPGGTRLITATPRPGAPVVWGKIVYAVEARRAIATKVSYYDEDGALVRTMTFEDVKVVDGRPVPTRMVVQPTDAPGESTELDFEQVRFDVPLSADRFSLRALRGNP